MIYIVIAVVACCVISYFVDKKISPNTDTEAKADVQESSEPIVKTPEEEFVSKINDYPRTMLPYIARYYTCEVLKGQYTDVEVLSAYNLNRKYLTNSFAFKNKYEEKAFAIDDTLKGIEANGDNLILTFGDGNYYHSKDGTQSQAEELSVTIYPKDLDDPDYKRTVEELRTGNDILLEGILVNSSSLGLKMVTGRILAINGKPTRLASDLAIEAFRELHNNDADSDT